MKKLLLLSVLGLSLATNAQLVNSRLVVPEFGNNTIKTYIPTSATTMAVDPSFTIILNSLPVFPTTASPNGVAMFNKDLFVVVTLANQRIYRFPNYGANPAASIANVQMISGTWNVSGDYVGITFDTSGNMYTTEGPSFNNTNIVKYDAPAYTTRTVLGNGGITSYLSNLAFDTAGNLWVSDYRNNRIAVIKAANLSTVNAPMNSLYNGVAVWNASGASISNTNPTLSGTTVNYAFQQPEGISFDSTGGLWVGNNNDGSSGSTNAHGTLVRISTGLQATILANTTTNANLSLLNTATGLKVWNLPNPGSRAQCGGLQIDKSIDRLYVNEQVGAAGLWFDIANINAMSDVYNTHKLSMISTNPGNGGIFLASNTQVLGTEKFDLSSNDLAIYPNPSNGEFKINALQKIESALAFDALGKQVEVVVNNDNYSIDNASKGLYFLKITFENGIQTTKKVVVN
jgi:Secretion system C-terminal sorting domain